MELTRIAIIGLTAAVVWWVGESTGIVTALALATFLVLHSNYMIEQRLDAVAKSIDRTRREREGGH